MIKAVFFDLYHTLIRYEPPREELQAKALKDFGINVKPENLRHPIMAADEFIYQELSRRSLSKRSDEDKMALWAQYQRVLLKEARIEPADKLVFGVLGKMQQTKMKQILFDDVVPVLAELKSRGLILGLISNIDRDITPMLKELGLPLYLKIIVTSQETGFNKPQPEIFQEALRRAGVQAAETVYVGDQYQIDVEGANKVGIKGILIDRGGYFAEVTGSPRIQSLSQVVDYL